MERKSRKLYIAITGEIGSGKTTVSKILRDYGYYVFDTDLFSKKLLRENKKVVELIENIIGQRVYENNKINFKKIGEVFDNNHQLEEEFEKWYQVFLGKEILKEALLLKNKNELLFFDIPLLEKKGIENEFDFLWIVESEKNKCYERVKKRNNYPSKKIDYLIKNSKINKKLLCCNYKIIENNKSIEVLKELIKAELDNLDLNNQYSYKEFEYL